MIDTGREEGREEGGRQRAQEIAKRMKAAGEPVAKIVAYTGLTADQIEQL